MTTKGVILEQSAPSTSHVEPDGGDSNPEITPETEAEKTVWQKSSPWAHGLLGVASFVPGLSIATGAADAAIYTAEGEFVEAGIAAASMIPGGKVVTTAGKVAKGAVGMAKGAGTAAKIAKGAHEAEEVLKAARKTEEAAKVAREAKAAEEAREAASGARKAKKEVTIKGREHKVPCFHPFDKRKFVQMNKSDQNAYLKEMAKGGREAKAAKEAREAEEARQVASAAEKPKKEVTVKGREHKVPCFHPYHNRKFKKMSEAERKAYLAEMAAQLKRQQEAINSLSVTEYKAARAEFIALKRNPALPMPRQAFVRKRWKTSRKVSAPV